MGKDSKSNELSKISNTAGTAYNNLQGSQTGLEKELIPQSQGMFNTYSNAANQQINDYGDIMGGYKSFASNMAGPRSFSAQQVSVNRPEELNQAYGYLNKAAPGYQTFADTGGYSDTDIQELRARGMSPIRSAYANSLMELDRSRALGSAGGSSNYIAALSKMQREQPGQMADAMTTVNAQLADAVRQGKLAGLGGLTNVGSQMGGMAGAESGRQLQAALGNQSADLQAQAGTQQALGDWQRAQLGALSGQAGLYGTTPAMAATFGNQALTSMGQRLTAEQLRNQYGLGLLGAQISASGGQTAQKSALDKLLGAAGSVAPYLGGGNQSGQPGGQPGQYTGGFEYPNGGNVYNSQGYDSAGNWQDPWGGWPSGDINSFEQYWNNPEEGRITGSGLGSMNFFDFQSDNGGWADPYNGSGFDFTGDNGGW